MNRRFFLSLLGQAAVGATVAYSFPSIVVPKNIQPVSAYPIGPYGLAYLINDQSRVLQGLSLSTFPDLNSPVTNLGGVALTRDMLEAARTRLSRYTYQPLRNNELLYYAPM